LSLILSIPEGLFSTYREVLGELLDCAWKKIKSFKRLKTEKYYELRAKYPSLPSHYIYTACQMACSI
jgi:putative transposase